MYLVVLTNRSICPSIHPSAEKERGREGEGGRGREGGEGEEEGGREGSLGIDSVGE